MSKGPLGETLTATRPVHSVCRPQSASMTSSAVDAQTLFAHKPRSLPTASRRMHPNPYGRARLDVPTESSSYRRMCRRALLLQRRTLCSMPMCEAVAAPHLSVASTTERASQNHTASRIPIVPMKFVRPMLMSALSDVNQVLQIAVRHNHSAIEVLFCRNNSERPCVEDPLSPNHSTPEAAQISVSSEDDYVNEFALCNAQPDYFAHL